MCVCTLLQSGSSCNTLTVHMSHLPVRDVHSLVVAWRERKHHHISSSEDAVDICLHHLKDSVRDQRRPTVFPVATQRNTLLTVMKPLESMWMPLCFKKPVAGTHPAGVQTHVRLISMFIMSWGTKGGRHSKRQKTHDHNTQLLVRSFF